MRDLFKNKTAIILSFLIGTLFGSGSIWQWQQSKLENEKMRFEKQQALRVSHENHLVRMLEMLPKFEKILSSGEDTQKIMFLRRFNNIYENYRKEEIELAKLEGRIPEIIEIPIPGNLQHFMKGPIIIFWHMPTAPINVRVRAE